MFIASDCAAGVDGARAAAQDLRSRPTGAKP
jgi:hypothetical protein